MALPIVESHSTASPGGTDDSLSIDRPSGVEPGEVLFAVVIGGAATSPPDISSTGWTQRQWYAYGNNVIAVFTRLTGGNEPDNYVFDYSESAGARRGGIVRISGAADDVSGNISSNEGTGETATALSITTDDDDCLVFMCCRWLDSNNTFSGNNQTDVFNINRVGVAYSSQVSAGATGDKTATTSDTNWQNILIAIPPATEEPNLPPSVTLDTPDEVELSPTPTLEFTGTDPDDDDITYRIEIADNPLFEDGIVVTSETDPGGTGTVIHPNPMGYLTWEGHIQVDDRVGFCFIAAGGKLDSGYWSFGPHETFPELTDGTYLARLYNTDGFNPNPLPPVWQPDTAYDVGEVIRPDSTANANVKFVYRCTIAGTSGSQEPDWVGNGVNWLSVTPGTTQTDGSVTWEALPGTHPVNAADEAETPTPGWLAESGHYPYSPGESDHDWKKLDFTGSERVRLIPGLMYMLILDWRPNNFDEDNTLAVSNKSIAWAQYPGNTYLDGALVTNNGPRIIDDPRHRIREELLSLQFDSETDSGFSNTVDNNDTDPFISGHKIAFALPEAFALEPAVYFWRVRGKDPAGTASFGDWSEVRTFTVPEAVEDDLIGNSDGQAAVSGAMQAVGNTTGQSDGQAAVSGAMQAVGNTTGQSDGQAAVSGAMQAVGNTTGQSDGQAAVSGAMQAVGNTTGQSDGQAAVSGAMQAGGNTTGQSDGQAAVSGIIGAGGDMTGQIDGQATVSAIPQAFGQVIGSSTGQANVDGIGAAFVNSVGMVSGESVVIGTMFGYATFAGIIEGQAIVDGVLTTDSDILFGTILGQAFVEGHLDTTITVSQRAPMMVGPF